MRALPALLIHQILAHRSDAALPANEDPRLLLPIDSRSNLYLHAHSHGNDWRFAKLFRQVWRVLPDADRIAMEQHWSQEAWRITGPSVALENLSRLRADKCIGDCAARGTELKFYARVIDRMPDDLVKYLIAHELAHVLQVSRGARLRPDPHPLGDRIAYMVSPVEKEADALALGWGYDGRGLDPWLDQHICWDSLPPDPY